MTAVTSSRKWDPSRDTRVGTSTLVSRSCARVRTFLILEPRCRAVKVLSQVVTEAYVLGISTRRVDRLVQSMGIEGISKSQVSRLAGDLDELVEEFRPRLLDTGP